MRRKQKITGQLILPGFEEMEAPGITAAPSISCPKPKEENGCESGLLEQIVSSFNMKFAYEKVKSNRGAAGIDGMTVEEMHDYLVEHYTEIKESLMNGTYRPQPVRRVEIPKPDGGVRLLGVPTVIDRMVQQAISQVLTRIYEPKFSDSSFGFRPGRNAQQAMFRALAYFRAGYTHVVDLDLAKYFDTVNHDLLMRMLEEEVKDRRVLRLIRRFLKSGVMVGGLLSPTTEGTPQGGPLSPLLSNIYLTKFDRELEKRGHKFVRYADDCNIYVKSRRAAERVMSSVTAFLEGRLRLKVNRTKSQIGSPMRLKFLGFSLWKIGEKSGIGVHAKTVKRFKDRVRQITRRNRGKNIGQILRELKTFTVGWLGYFGIATMSGLLKKLDSWIRRRLRCYLWKQWKRIRTRQRNLLLLGATAENARRTANTRHGLWWTSGTAAIQASLTNEYLIALGFDPLYPRYHQRSSND